jgi:hypothetical protein
MEKMAQSIATSRDDNGGRQGGAAMLYDPDRHEPCLDVAWNEARARAAIEWIVRDTEARFTPERHWPIHPRDADQGDTAALTAFYPLYFGACGVIWALQHLQHVGAVQLERSYAPHVGALLSHNRAWLGADSREMFASYLMGDTGILLLAQMLAPDPQAADRLEAAIAGNIDHPARELMWGAPGTMLAALFMHRHTGEARWADLFRRSARRLWAQLLWSDQHQCHYWTQDMYGTRSSYLDAVHGFVATASVLIGGRHLLDADEWAAWQACIENTVRRSASVDGELVNWRAWLLPPPGSARRMLVQFCHGAPGFVICLGDLPGTALDDLLLAAGETTWQAGPLQKGSNLCHGTGGNGHAFLKLYRRTRDPVWLARARAFAMHGIAQTEAEAAEHGRLRYSLWTGDPGFAVYLWHCIQGTASFPTLDEFFGPGI